MRWRDATHMLRLQHSTALKHSTRFHPHAAKHTMAYGKCMPPPLHMHTRAL